MNSNVKDRLLWGIAGLLAGVVLTNAGVIVTIRNAVVREYRSPHNLETTIQTIAANAANRGWKTGEPLVFNPEMASSKQYPTAVRILELSHPDYARAMVAFGRNRSVAMAPTTLVVYEQNGQVYVATVNNGLIGRFFHHEPAGPIGQKEADEKQIMAFLAKR